VSRSPHANTLLGAAVASLLVAGFLGVWIFYSGGTSRVPQLRSHVTAFNPVGAGHSSWPDELKVSFSVTNEGRDAVSPLCTFVVTLTKDAIGVSGTRSGRISMGNLMPGQTEFGTQVVSTPPVITSGRHTYSVTSQCS